MPCSDGDWAPYAPDRTSRERDQYMASFCAAMTQLLRSGQTVHWDEMAKQAGVDVKALWLEHMKRDRQKKERDAAQAHQERVKLAALRKLTEEERRLLGIDS